MNLVKNKFTFLFLLLFIYNCSFDNKTGIWKDKKIEKENNKNIEDIFTSRKIFKEEINPNIKIKIISKANDKSFLNNLDNNKGRSTYNGKLQILNKFKFSNTKNFNKLDNNIIVYNQNVIFFDNKGTILNFNKKSKLNWKKNVYTRSEKKLKPILSFSLQDNILVVADNLARYYAININTGDLIWSKRNSSQFNSQIKISDNKIFIVDYENTLRCFSIKTGNEIWNVQTENTFVKSDKKLSIAILQNKIFFNNSIGDVSLVDKDTGELIWQIPTQKNSIYEDAFLLKMSNITLDDQSIYLSTNKNQFFSIDQNTGFVNWQQSINSHLTSTIVDNLIFIITSEGFLFILEKKNGEVIRSTYIFDKLKENKRKDLKPVGFVMGEKNIYLSTSKGYLIIINIISGKALSIKKIHGGKILRPNITNDSLYILKSNGIVQLN